MRTWMRYAMTAFCVATVAMMPGVARAANFLLPGETILTQKTADVTGDQMDDEIYLVGKREGDNGFMRDVNIVVVDGADKTISRSLFSLLAGYRSTIEIGDFNGDRVNDVLFTLQKGDLSTKVYVAAFNKDVPQIIFQSDGDAPEHEVRSGDVAIMKEDDGKTVYVKNGSSLQLRLPENPSTGYTWQFVKSTGGECVEFIGQQNFIPSGEPQMAGKPGLKVFSFRIKQTGTMEMELANYRTWEGASSATDRFRVTVKIVE